MITPVEDMIGSKFCSIATSLIWAAVIIPHLLTYSRERDGRFMFAESIGKIFNTCTAFGASKESSDWNLDMVISGLL